ncbi:MAG: DUF58 domain-containing protein [Clostridiaceae bacterium]|nr:DUF58 domain-containing protein [Clostridiaceae bacterium]
MNTHRIVFFSISAILLLAGLLSGIRLFYVLLISQAGLLFCSLVLNIWAVTTFTYLQQLSNPTTLRGQMVHLTLALHNEKPLPFPLTHIQVAVADEPDYRDMTFNLVPHSQMSFDLELNCPYRGEYAVGMTIIDFLDLFGLLRLPFDMRLLPYYRMPLLLVYPRLIKLERLNMPALDAHHFSRLQALTEDHNEPYAMVRPYRPGDPGKQIHWKVSLRQRELMTRLYEQAAEPSVDLLLDLGRSRQLNESSRQAEDVLCECAAALIYYLLSRHWHVRVIGYGRKRQVMTGSDLHDFQALYHWLARVSFDSQQDFFQQIDRDWTNGVDLHAVLMITTRPDPRLGPISRQGRIRQISCYTLVAGPAHADPLEKVMAERFHQDHLPIWFIHYGESLADVLQADR